MNLSDLNPADPRMFDILRKVWKIYMEITCLSYLVFEYLDLGTDSEREQTRSDKRLKLMIRIPVYESK